MGGGIISLVANGAQDIYLTGNPQITYFKVMYRRYTNFAVETIEHAIDSAKPGGRYSIQVQRNGDLASKTALRLKLDKVTAANLNKKTGETTSSQKVAWVRRLGHAALKSAEVKIGGITIDKHVGVWMDIWYELTRTESEEAGYRALIGDVDDLTKLRGPTTTLDSETILPEYTMYIPLQFWFCRNYGQALPLIALQYHEVRVDVELEEIGKLMCYTGSTAPKMSSWSYKEAGLMVDYVYLESAERRRYAQYGHEYLIEQVQFSGEENISINSNSATNNQKFKLNYNHPTKEIIWALKIGAFNGEANRNSSSDSSKFLCYTNDDNWSGALDYAAKNIVESLVISGKTSTDLKFKTTGDYFDLQTETSSTKSVKDVLENNRIKVQLIKQDGLILKDATGLTDALRVVKAPYLKDESEQDKAPASATDVQLMNWALDSIDEAVVRVVLDTTNKIPISINCVSVKHSLNLTDASIPVSKFDKNVTSVQTLHPDVTVTQPNNYGLRLDGKGNPIHSANIQLNGHDRFSMQEGSYFNYYQTKNHHTHTPADGINVYSFALFPEKHQPSGTTNLSRIDSAILNLNISDSLRQSRNKLDISTNTQLFIFALSINVLRAMSGMAGLAYSN